MRHHETVECRIVENMEEDKNKGFESILSEIIAENFPRLEKAMNMQIQ